MYLFSNRLVKALDKSLICPSGGIGRYFCSKKCAGKYGREIQLGLRKPEKVEKINPTKYSLHQH